MTLKKMLIEDFYGLTEEQWKLFETDVTALTDEMLQERHFLVKDILEKAFGISRKYVSEVESKFDTYEITLSRLCSKIKTLLPDDKCLREMRDKLLKSRLFSTYRIDLIDDIIRISPAV